MPGGRLFGPRRRRGRLDYPLIGEGDRPKEPWDDNLPSDSRVVGVFVAHFNVATGNVLEWSHPAGVEMATVEFKALTSGQHCVENDCVVFRHGERYGIAAFNRRITDESGERHSRMRSVGLIATHLQGIFRFEDALRGLVVAANEQPGDYDAIRCFFESSHNKVPAALHNDSVPTKLVGFVRDFGPTLFLLWKAQALHKRIVFYSPPPIQPLCLWVYFTTQLMVSSYPGRRCSPPAFFSVSVSDSAQLARAPAGYVACTTDRILLEKVDFWDVCVAGTKARVSRRCAKQIHPTRGDRLRWEALAGELNVVDGAGGCAAVVAGRMQLFFQELNDGLWRRILESNGSRAHIENRGIVRPRDLRRFGLHRQEDAFMRELIRVHQLPLVMRSNQCVCC